MIFKEGYLYEIVFDDHTVGSDGPVKCKAVGYVISDHKDYVRMSSWCVLTDCVTTFNSNLEKFVVLKSCISTRRLLCKKSSIKKS